MIKQKKRSFKQMILGAGIGYIMGIAMHRILNWIKLEFEGLYSVLLITLVLFTFSFSEFIGGNAFLSVYISACILGNRDFQRLKLLESSRATFNVSGQ